MVCNSTTDDIRHIAMIALLRERLFRITVETSQGGEMDVATEDSDADAVFRRDVLQGLNEVFALVFMLARGVVVV